MHARVVVSSRGGGGGGVIVSVLPGQALTSLSLSV